MALSAVEEAETCYSLKLQRVKTAVSVVLLQEKNK